MPDSKPQNGETDVRILIGAGGTGGHVYPALATAEALVKQPDANLQLFFVGAVSGMERRLVQESGIPFASYDEVQAGPLHGVNPLRAIISVVKLLIGIIQSLILILRHRPQSMLLTGGWANVPIALAGWLLRVPIVIYLPDIEPGLTIKILKYFARKVAITVPDASQYFREGQTVVTGYPLRQSLMEATQDAGIEHFQLDSATQDPHDLWRESRGKVD